MDEAADLIESTLTRLQGESSKQPCVVVPLSVMEKVDAAIKFYASMESYLPPRTGGVVQGCPRSGTPPIFVDRGKRASDVLMELVKLYPLVRDGER